MLLSFSNLLRRKGSGLAGVTIFAMHTIWGRITKVWLRNDYILWVRKLLDDFYMKAGFTRRSLDSGFTRRRSLHKNLQLLSQHSASSKAPTNTNSQPFLGRFVPPSGKASLNDYQERRRIVVMGLRAMIDLEDRELRFIMDIRGFFRIACLALQLFSNIGVKWLSFSLP